MRQGLWEVMRSLCGALLNGISSLMAQQERICLPIQVTQKMWVRSLGQADTLEEGMATHSSIIAWEIS